MLCRRYSSSAPVQDLTVLSVRNKKHHWGCDHFGQRANARCLNARCSSGRSFKNRKFVRLLHLTWLSTRSSFYGETRPSIWTGPFFMSMFFHRSILSPTRVQLNLDLSIWSQIKIFPSSNFRCNSVGLFIYLFRLKTTGQNLTTDNNYPPICTT